MTDEAQRRRRVVELLTRSPRSRNETANDQWIMRDVFPGKRDGYFVECGAGDGVVGSSCFPLERTLGWRGICVEPLDYLFDHLCRNRPGSVCFDVCVGRAAGEVEFLAGRDPRSPARWFSGIAEHVQRKLPALRPAMDEFVPVRKQVRPLAALLREAGAPPLIDYLALDIEGSELDVLSVFPFDTYQVRAISLECDESMSRGIAALLVSNGFSEVRNPFNRDRRWERYWLAAGLGAR